MLKAETEAAGGSGAGYSMSYGNEVELRDATLEPEPKMRRLVAISFNDKMCEHVCTPLSTPGVRVCVSL